MKRIYITLVLAVIVLLCGCAKRVTSKTIPKPDDMTQAEYFNLLVREDVKWDKRSVCWDGETASVIEDQLDDDDIIYAESHYDLVEVPGAYSFSILGFLDPAMIKDDSAKHYHLAANNCEIMIEQVDYEEAKSEIEKDTNMEALEDDYVRKEMIRGENLNDYESYVLYRGIMSIPDADEATLQYAGYVLLCKSALTEQSYRITCGGIGNIRDINHNTRAVMNDFEVERMVP